MSCSPALIDYSSEDFCNKEELVVFNVPFLYPPGSDIIIRYTLGSRVNATPLDWIGIFQSGFQSTCHPLTFQWATVNPPHPSTPLERIATFPAKLVQALESKDASYQFAYVSKENMVLGCSQDFMLKHDDTWDMDMGIYDISTKRTKPRSSDHPVPHTDSWSESPDLLSGEEEWEFANQSPVKPDSPSVSDLSDIVVLSTSPSKEAAKLLLLQAPRDHEACILKSFSFSSDESSDEIVQISIDKKIKQTDHLDVQTHDKKPECTTQPDDATTVPQYKVSCFDGSSPVKKPKRLPMKSKIARIQKKTGDKTDKVKVLSERNQYPHSIYSKFKFIDNDSNSDDESLQLAQNNIKKPIEDKPCLIHELVQEDECAENISSENSSLKSAKCKKAKKAKSKKPIVGKDEVGLASVEAENNVSDVVTKSPDDTKKLRDVPKNIPTVVFDELEGGKKEVASAESKKVVKCRKKQVESSQVPNSVSQVPNSVPQVPNSASQVPNSASHVPNIASQISDSASKIPKKASLLEKTPDKVEVETEKDKKKEKQSMKVARQLERKSKRSSKKCPEPIVTDEQVDNHMEIYSIDAKKQKPQTEKSEVEVRGQSGEEAEKELANERLTPRDEIMSIKQKYIYSKKGRSKKKKRQQAKLKAQVLYNLEPLFGGAQQEEQQNKETDVPKSTEQQELPQSFVLQDTSDQGFPALPSLNKTKPSTQPPTTQASETLSEISPENGAKETTETNKCQENPSDLSSLCNDRLDAYPDLKYLNVPAYLLDIMDALPAPRAECDDSSLVEMKRAIPPHLTRASLQHFKAKYKLKYSKRHELHKMKLKGRYLNPCFMDCIKNNITELKSQKNIFVLHNTEASSDIAFNNAITFSTSDADRSLVCPETPQNLETANNMSIPQPQQANDSSLNVDNVTDSKAPGVQLEVNVGKKLPLSYASVVKKSPDAPEAKSSCVLININPEDESVTDDKSKQSEKVTINEFLAEDDGSLDEPPLQELPTKSATTRSEALKTLAKVLKRRTKEMDEAMSLSGDKDDAGTVNNTAETGKESEVVDITVNPEQNKISLFWPMPKTANVALLDHLTSHSTSEASVITCPPVEEHSGLHVRPVAKGSNGKIFVTGDSPPERRNETDEDKASCPPVENEPPGQDDPKAVLDLALATSLVENNFLKEKVAALESQLKVAEEELQRVQEDARTVVLPLRKSKTITHRRVAVCKWTDNVKNLVRSNVEIFSLKSKLKDNMMEIMSLENQVNSLKEAYNVEMKRVAKANMKWLKLKLKHKETKAKLRAYEEKERLLTQAQDLKESQEPDDNDGNESADYEPPHKRRRIEQKQVSNALKSEDVHYTSATRENEDTGVLKHDEAMTDSIAPDPTEPANSSSNVLSSSVSNSTCKQPEVLTASPQYHSQPYHMSRSCTPKYARVKTDLFPATPVSGWPSSYSSSPPAYLQSLQAYLPPRPTYTNTTANWYNPFPTQCAGGKQMKQRTSPPHLPLPYPTAASPPKHLYQPCFPYSRRKSPFQQPHFCSIQSPPQSNCFRFQSDQSPKRRSPPLLPLPIPQDTQSANHFRDLSVSPPRQKRYSSRSPSGCNRHFPHKHGLNDHQSVNFSSSMNQPILHYPPSPGKSLSTPHPFSHNDVSTPDHVVPDVLNSHVNWGSRPRGGHGAWYDPNDKSFINTGYAPVCGKHCGGAESGQKAKACVAPFQSRKDLTGDTTMCPTHNGFMAPMGTHGSPGLSNFEQNQRYHVNDANRVNSDEFSDRQNSRTQHSDFAAGYETGKARGYEDPVLPQTLEMPPGAQFQSHFLRNLVKKEGPRAQYVEPKNMPPRDAYVQLQTKPEPDYYRQHLTQITNYPTFSHPLYGALDQRPQPGNVYPFNLFQNGAATDDAYAENITHNKINHAYERKGFGPQHKNGPVTSCRYPVCPSHAPQQFPGTYNNEKSVVELNVHGMVGYQRDNGYRTAQTYETSVDKGHIEASEANHHIA